MLRRGRSAGTPAAPSPSLPTGHRSAAQIRQANADRARLAKQQKQPSATQPRAAPKKKGKAGAKGSTPGKSASPATPKPPPTRRAAPGPKQPVRPSDQDTIDAAEAVLEGMLEEETREGETDPPLGADAPSDEEDSSVFSQLDSSDEEAAVVISDEDEPDIDPADLHAAALNLRSAALVLAPPLARKDWAPLFSTTEPLWLLLSRGGLAAPVSAATPPTQAAWAAALTQAKLVTLITAPPAPQAQPTASPPESKPAVTAKLQFASLGKTPPPGGIPAEIRQFVPQPQKGQHSVVIGPRDTAHPGRSFLFDVKAVANVANVLAAQHNLICDAAALNDPACAAAYTAATSTTLFGTNRPAVIAAIISGVVAPLATYTLPPDGSPARVLDLRAAETALSNLIDEVFTKRYLVQGNHLLESLKALRRTKSLEAWFSNALQAIPSSLGVANPAAIASAYVFARFDAAMALWTTGALNLLVPNFEEQAATPLPADDLGNTEVRVSFLHPDLFRPESFASCLAAAPTFVAPTPTSTHQFNPAASSGFSGGRTAAASGGGKKRARPTAGPVPAPGTKFVRTSSGPPSASQPSTWPDNGGPTPPFVTAHLGQVFGHVASKNPLLLGIKTGGIRVCGKFLLNGSSPPSGCEGGCGRPHVDHKGVHHDSTSA